MAAPMLDSIEEIWPPRTRKQGRKERNAVAEASYQLGGTIVMAYAPEQGGRAMYRGAFGRMVALSSLGALLATALAGAHASAQPPTKAEIDRAADARNQYGFDSGRSHVASLASGKTHPASAEYGFPMTAAEARDLLDRAAFVQRLAKETLPQVRGLADYAGAWIDLKDGGRLVVGLTRAPASIKASVRRGLPKVSRGIRFEVVNDSARAPDVAEKQCEVDGAQPGEWGEKRRVLLASKSE